MKMGTFAFRGLVVCVIAALLATTAVAQRGSDRGGRGDRGGGGRGSFGGGGGEDFRARILSRMDANGNGMIDPDEAQGRARGFIDRMAQQAGIDPSRAMSISRLTGSGNDRNNDRNNRRGRDDEEEEEDPYASVAGFGSDNVVGFGIHPYLLSGVVVDMKETYDERVLRDVERTFDRYDENENGVLDREEWSEVRWRNDPRESDLDGDGRLTQAEFAQRSVQDSQNRGRGDDRNRGGGFAFGGFGRGRGGDDNDNDDRRNRFAGFGRRGGGDEGDENGGRGGRGGGGRGGRGGGRGGGFGDPAAMVARLDQNGDGTIDPDEVDERISRFVGQRFQIDFSQPVKVSDLQARIAGEGGGRGNRGQRQNEQEKKEEELKASYRVAGADHLQGRSSYRTVFSKRGKGNVPQWFSSRDKNTDGQVALNEYMARASDSAVREFLKYDANGDGFVSRTEAGGGDKE